MFLAYGQNFCPNYWNDQRSEQETLRKLSELYEDTSKRKQQIHDHLILGIQENAEYVQIGYPHKFEQMINFFSSFFPHHSLFITI